MALNHFVKLLAGDLEACGSLGDGQAQVVEIILRPAGPGEAGSSSASCVSHCRSLGCYFDVVGGGMWFRKEFAASPEAFQVKRDGFGEKLAHFLL